MFGIEKVFGKIPKEQAEKKSSGGFGSPEKPEAEIVFFEQSLEVGQRWRTGDGNFELVISDQRKGSGRYQIAFHDRKTGVSEVQLKGSEDLKELLSSGGYKLITKRSEGSESKLSFPSVVPVTSDQNSVISGTAETENVPAPSLDVQETAAAATDPQLPEPQPEQPERLEMPSLLDEYLSLSAEIQEITEIKSAAIGTAVGELLEENADVLEEKGDEFFGLRDTYIASINSIVDEENALSETVEAAGQKITPEQLETTKANHKKLIDLYAQLASLKELVVLEIKRNQDLSPEKEASSVASEEKDTRALPEQSAPIATGNVLHIDDYRKNSLSKPAAKPMDSPFGGDASAKTETNDEQSGAVAVKTENVPSEKKDAARVGAKNRREAREGKNTELFDAVSKALKENQVFRKDGEPMLVIRDIALQKIDMEYKKAVSDTVWHQETIRPNDTRDFLEYLKNTFGWTPEQKKRKTSKPEPKRKHTSERIAAAKTGEGVANDVQPEGERTISEKHAEEEQTYEEREKSLSAVKKKQLGSVVSEGLAPLVLHTEQDKGVTLHSLVDRIGIEKLAQSIVQSIVTILPTESGWDEKERSEFATEFAKREIIESLE